MAWTQARLRGDPLVKKNFPESTVSGSGYNCHLPCVGLISLIVHTKKPDHREVIGDFPKVSVPGSIKR
jgi:hypothetical protein